MSNLFKYTKRVLTSVLAAAVVLTAIPSTAFGAEVDGDVAIDVLETEVAEAGEEVVVENEDAVTTDGASGDEDVEIGEEEEALDKSAYDVEVMLKLESATHLDLADVSSGDALTPIPVGTPATKVGDDHSDKKWKASDYPAATTLRYVGVDSTSADGYSFYLVADEGYDFKDKPIKSVEYYDFSTSPHDDWNVPEVKKAALHKLDTPSTSTFTVTPVEGKPELVKVTLSKSFLQTVEKGSYYSDYTTTRADRADLRFNPQILVTIDDVKGIKSKEFPMSSLTLSPDIAGSDMHKDSIAVANRTAIFTPGAISGTDESVLIANLGGYVTGKTIEDKMITVTYTPLTADAEFSEKIEAVAGSTISKSGKKYVKYALGTATTREAVSKTETTNYQNLNPHDKGWFDSEAATTVTDITSTVTELETGALNPGDPLPSGTQFVGAPGALTATLPATWTDERCWKLSSDTFYKDVTSTTTPNLSLYTGMVNDYVTGKANLAVYVDGSLADTKYKTVTVAPNSYVKGVYKADGTTALSGTKFEFAKNLGFVVEMPATSESVTTNTRTVKEIVVKENNDGDEHKLAGPGTDSNPKWDFTLTGDTVDDDITVTVTTQEVVSVANVATGIKLYDTEGKQITGSSHIDSGTQNFEFEVVPTKGNEIDKVQYSFEGDSAWVDATASGNNFKIPVKIEKGINFKVTEKNAETKKDVTIKNTKDAADWAAAKGATIDPQTDGIAAVYDNAVLFAGIGTATEFPGTTWTVASAATESKYYYFTVKTNAGYVPIAKYFFGTQATADYTKYKDAKLVSSDETNHLYVYRTNETMPINTSEVGLCIRARAAVKVTKPANAMVKTSFGDEVIVPTDETYSFTIETKPGKGTVVVKKVTYTTDGTAPDATKPELTLSGGKYTLGTGVLTGATAVKLFVQTEETITSGFTTKYALATDSDKYPSLTGTVGSQKLTLSYGQETSALTAEFKTTDRVPKAITSTQAGYPDRVAADKDTEGMWAVSHDATVDSKKDIATLANDSTAGVLVTGAKLGTDTITATLKQNNTDGDIKIYKGSSLPVEVKESWTNLRLVAVSDYTDAESPVIMAQTDVDATADDNHVVEFRIKGTNTKTGKEAYVTDLTSGITKVEFLFDPDNKGDNADTQTYRMAATNVKFDDMLKTTGATDPANNSVFVRAKDATTPNVKLIATVTLEGATKTTELERDFTIVEEGTYAPYSTYKLAGGEEVPAPWDLDTDYDPANPLVPPTYAYIIAPNTIVDPELELKSGGINSVVIDYPLYKQNTQKVTIATQPADKDELAKEVAKGNYEAVTSGVEITATVPEKRQGYVSASVSGTKVTITALKNTAGSYIPVTIDAFKDGVIVAETDIYVCVVNNVSKSKVRLLLDDFGTYTLNDAKDTSTPVQQALTSAAYTGRKNSIIEPNNNVKLTDLVATGDAVGAGIKSIRGIEFTDETPDMTFTLPTQAAFDASKIGKGRILLGWVAVTNATLAGYTEHATAFFYPGEAVVIDDNAAKNIYHAFWADEYSFADAVTAAGDYKGLGRVLYNGLDVTKDDKGVITAYGPFSNVSNAATPAKGTTGQLAAGNTMPLAIKLEQRIPYTKDLKAKVKSGDIADFDTATTKDEYKTGADGLALTVGGTEKARLTAASGSISIASNADAITNVFNELLNVTASWTDTASGNVFKTCEIPVDVIGDQKYTVAFKSDNPKTLLVDQSNNNKLTVELKKDGTLQTNGNTTNFTAFGFSYKAEPEGIVEITSVENAGVIGTASEDANIIAITPLKAGTATITVTVVDATGLNKSATTTLEVKDNGIAFTITDVNTNTTVAGTEADPLQALAYNGTSTTTSANYTIVASPAVTFKGEKDTDPAVEADDAVVADGANTKFLTDGKTLQIATKGGPDLSDEGYVLVHYKKNGDTSGTLFTKKLYVGTYYNVVLAKGTYEIYKGDTKVVTPGTTTPADGTVRVTLANRVNVGTEDAPDYVYRNIDLSEFSAKDPAKAKTWIGWNEKSKAAPTGQKYTYKEKIDQLTYDSADGAAKTLQSGLFTLDPVMAVNPITKAVIGQTTIRLSNEAGVPLAGTTEKINEKNIVLNVEPYDTKDTITIVPEKNKAALFQGKAGGTSKKIAYKAFTDSTTPGTFDVPVTTEIGFTAGKAVLPFGDNNQDKDHHDGAVIVDGTKKERMDNFNVAAITDLATRRAGSIEFDIQSTSSGLSLGKLTVVINGYDAVDDQYFENGVAVVNDSRTVNGETWFFNEKGNHVTGDAIITKADGSKIAIDNGALVPANTLVTLTGDYAGTYYVKATGTIAAGELIKLSNVNRLFRENGTLVTYSDKDVVDGKIKVGNVTYKIDPTTSEATPDKKMVNAKVEWTVAWPKEYTKGTAYPKGAYEIKYTLEGETTQQTTGLIPVTATSDPADLSGVGVTSVKFTMTANVEGFFSDAKGNTPLTDAGKTKTYTFKNGSSTATSGQDVDPEGDITIEGLEDSYPWTGKQIKPTFSVYDSVAGKYLAKGVDYTVKYGKNKDAGTKAGTITITGKGNYAKAGKAASFDIVKEELSDPAGIVKSIAKLDAKDYTGSPIYPDAISVTLEGGSTVTMKHQGDGVYSNEDIGGKELAVSVTNNVDKGTANVAVWGAKKNGKDAVKTATFKINAKSMEGANKEGLGNPFDVTISKTADFRIKTTRPEVNIKFNGNDLIEGQDYKIDVNVKKGTVKVSGKGNFNKNFTETFTINPLSLAECEIVAATVYAGAKPSQVKVTILDPNGDPLKTSNYSLEVKPDDDALDSKGKLIEGKNVHVKAIGKGANVDTETYIEGDFTVAKNIGNAKFKVNNTLTYTGEELKPDDDWVNANVTVTLKGASNPKAGEDFEITGYQNNVKKGTMTVYVAGKGDYSGLNKFKVKIVAKPFGK